MKFTISGTQFSLSEPYKEGHLLTDSEAKALNSARSDRLRESVRRWMLDQQRELGREDLPIQVLQTIQSRLVELDTSFVFGQHGPRAKSNLTVESEARALAEARVLPWAETLEPRLSEEQIEAEIESVASDPRVLDEARRRVAAKTRVAREMLGALL